MVSITERFSTLQLQSLKAMQAYTLASLNGVEKLAELNLQAAKKSVEEGVSTSVALFHSRDPKALADTVSVQAKPATDKLGAYAKHVFQIANETAAELSRIAEKQMSEASQQMFATIDEISKGAPAGTEGIATFYKSAVSAANSAWGQVSKANKQVLDLTEANVDRATGAARRPRNVALPDIGSRSRDRRGASRRVSILIHDPLDTPVSGLSSLRASGRNRGVQSGSALLRKTRQNTVENTMNSRHFGVIGIAAALIAISPVSAFAAGQLEVVAKGDLKWKDMGAPGLAAATVSGEHGEGREPILSQVPGRFRDAQASPYLGSQRHDRRWHGHPDGGWQGLQARPRLIFRAQREKAPHRKGRGQRGGGVLHPVDWTVGRGDGEVAPGRRFEVAWGQRGDTVNTIDRLDRPFPQLAREKNGPPKRAMRCINKTENAGAQTARRPVGQLQHQVNDSAGEVCWQRRTPCLLLGDK